MTTFKTTCKIGACEKFCGILADVQDGVLTRVRFDPNHPITKGCGCIKGMHVPNYQNDPDRLLYPQQRVGDSWQRVPWDTATTDIGKKLKRIKDTYGPNAISTYWGNASDSLSIMLSTSFCHAFGSPNSFNTLSLEYTDRGVVAQRVYGNENFILQPDLENAEFALLLGTNPFETQGMTLLQRSPNIQKDLVKLSKRGTLVVADPRKTKTTRIANIHLPIQPGTDLYLLLGMIKHILSNSLYNSGFCTRFTSGFGELCKLFNSLDLGECILSTGIPLTTIQSLAEQFASAKGAFVTTRVGVQTSRNSTLTEWAVVLLNAITGNIDRPGGIFFNHGAIDIPQLLKKFTKRMNTSPSAIGNFMPIFGGLPASEFADNVLSDMPDR